MELSKSREVVIEIEYVRTVRKRAVTRLMLCPECRVETDFLKLSQTARLFGVTVGELVSFVNANRCHRTVAANGDVHICLTGLLSVMKSKTESPELRLIGGTNT